MAVLRNYLQINRSGPYHTIPLVIFLLKFGIMLSALIKRIQVFEYTRKVRRIRVNR